MLARETEGSLVMARAKAAAACLVLAVCVLFAAAPAWADFGKRYALVIGNSDYAHVERLPNTGRDAEAMAEALEALRFSVFKGIDLTADEFDRLLGEFEAASAEADTVVFYYAGHAVQLDELNHLLPVDAVLSDPSRIDAETLVLDDIIKRIHRRQRQTIVFLDASRKNPLPESAEDGSGDGLAPVGAGAGTFVSFAALPGDVSYEGRGKNSPFSEALITHIGKPGQSISDLMIDVRNDVSDRTVGRQVPWDQSSLRADFFFNPSPQYVAMSEPAQGGIVIGRAGGITIGGGGNAEGDALSGEAPLSEDVPIEDPATEEAVTEEPVTEALATADPIADEPATDEPVTEVPAIEVPVTEVPAIEEPVTEEPVTEDPSIEDPVTEKPATEEPVTVAVTEEPATEEPVTEEPVTEEPVTEEPVTEAVTQKPATEVPLAEAVFEEPVSKEPVTAEPVTPAVIEELVTADPVTADPATKIAVAEVTMTEPRPQTATSTIIGPPPVEAPITTRPAAGPATTATPQRLQPEREWFPDDEAPPAEEERQMAAIDPQQPLAPDLDVQPQEPLVDPLELARSIQSDLARIGCYRMSVDGEWGQRSRTSLEQYFREKGEAATSLEPSADLLAKLQSETGTVCSPPATPKAKKPAVAAPAEKKAKKPAVAAPAEKKAKKPAVAAPAPKKAPAVAAVPPPPSTAKKPKIIGF